MRASLALAWVPALLLGGCITSDVTYIRTDGQRVAGNPLLEQQYEKDSGVCSGETDKVRAAAPPITASGLAAGVAGAKLTEDMDRTAQGCMSQKGYVQVYQNIADVRLAEFAAAEEKRKREAAAAGPAPGAKTPAKPKKKPAAAL